MKEENPEQNIRLAEIARKFEGVLNDNFNPSAKEVGEYWVERLRQEEARADLHATLNRKIADALGLASGDDWSCLPKMVSNIHFENKQVHEIKHRAEVAEALVYQLRNMILLLLDQIDYTNGACRINEMVGAVLGTNLIQAARKLLKGGEG